ncbi:hypothetical protein [Rummeliibacillus stabekisii]|uniref:Uncharacterized protein n=1 Tax=Rummeliibacillus stabekisii TaxID=241244 RepID=A0A143HA99_9BACL|nr:hypothetical protein [Rummeliibacillus stabekisii]AMW98415.1 hypothetical protein ATY39_02595 [Rummeliibacillus stabekisii]
MNIKQAILDELKEIKKALQTIASSKEQEVTLDGKKISKAISALPNETYIRNGRTESLQTKDSISLRANKIYNDGCIVAEGEFHNSKASTNTKNEVKALSETDEMIEALETLVINKAKSMQDEVTSPDEIAALTELVKVVNQTPRTLKAINADQKRVNRLGSMEVQLDLEKNTGIEGHLNDILNLMRDEAEMMANKAIQETGSKEKAEKRIIGLKALIEFSPRLQLTEPILNAALEVLKRQEDANQK